MSKNKKQSILVVILLLLPILAACGKQDIVSMEEKESVITLEATELPTNAETVAVNAVNMSTIKTAYISLQLSSERAENIHHMEVTEGDTSMEVFYMICEGGEKELFRIYFGQDITGDPIGILHTDMGEVPVSVTVSAYDEKDFSSDEDVQLYNVLMGELNTLLNAIRNDRRFESINENPSIEMETVEASMSYWNVILPENMEMEENDTHSGYQADFYGTIAGNRIKLYSIYLGECEIGTPLGTFQVGEEIKPVYVKNYDLQIKESWSDEDVSSAYTMMATINDVIEEIMSSENFSAVIPE